jgi:NAD(P)H-nitrite reductase large subunit
MKYKLKRNRGNKMCDELICRCEEVSREEIEAAIADGASTMNEIKRFTRAGMGLCQGRTCRRLVERILSENTDTKLSEIQPSTYRQPVRPVRSDLIQEHDNKSEGGTINE